MYNNFAIIELYCGASGKIGFYNNQELGITKGMTKLGYKCYVFYPDIESKTISEEQHEDVTVVRCPAKHIGVHSFYDWNILKQYNINYAQIDSDNQLFAPDVIRFCENNNIIIYNYIGTIKTDSNNKIKNLFSKILIKRNLDCYKKTKCFVKTKQLQKEMKECGVESDIVHVGLDFSLIPEIKEDKKTLKKKLGIPENKDILLFVGRMELYKRPFDMFQIMRKVDDRYFGIMIGTGSLSLEIDSRIQKEFKDKIIRIDKVENKQIHQYYKISEYFLNFNEKEIFGMSMLEATYQGCNVIAIRSPGAEEIINNNYSGYLVDSIDEMSEIIANNKKLNSGNMKNEIINGFSWDKNILKFNEALSNI